MSELLEAYRKFQEEQAEIEMAERRGRIYRYISEQYPLVDSRDGYDWICMHCGEHLDPRTIALESRSSRQQEFIARVIAWLDGHKHLPLRLVKP